MLARKADWYAMHLLVHHTDPLQIPFDHNGGYYFGDDYVRAFSHTHMVGAGTAPVLWLSL